MLTVHLQERRVGTLWSDARVLHFQYDTAWLAYNESFPLSPRLPLQSDPHRGDEVVYFFSNLLPEGPILAAILKLKRLPAGDIYAQLEALGEDAAGAFSITPQDATRHRTPHYQPYPPRAIRADIERLASNIPLLAQHVKLRLSLAGAQNKIPVYYNGRAFSLPADGAASTHILKPALVPARQFPDSVENEALCLALARACGLDAVEATIADIPPPSLVVRRYDRFPRDEQIKRLHQLDFCQLAGVLPDQKYEKDGGPGLKDVFELIDQHSTLPGKDRLKALDGVIFNYAIGNADAHAKNLAMLVGPGTTMRLAPFYDIVCTAIYPELDTRMAMSIGGEYRPKWVRPDHWRQFCADTGLNFSLLRKRAGQLVTQMIDTLPQAARTLGLATNSGIAKKITGVVVKRRSSLELVCRSGGK
jgi:serine/threonine-protein kinase HipA